MACGADLRERIQAHEEKIKAVEYEIDMAKNDIATLTEFIDAGRIAVFQKEERLRTILANEIVPMASYVETLREYQRASIETLENVKARNVLEAKIVDLEKQAKASREIVTACYKKLEQTEHAVYDFSRA